MNERVAVLICTYNRPDLLQRALVALIDRSIIVPEQVVVVNGGDQRANVVVRNYIGRRGVDVRLITTVNRNLATSRNLGLAHCDGTIIAMTDDDAEVAPDWVAQVRRLHRAHPEAGAIGGPVFGSNTRSLVGKVADLISFPAWPEAREVRTLPGVNIAYKRAAIERLGPQDEQLFRGEDVDYNWRLLQLGYTIRYEPAVSVAHYHRPTLRGLLRQHYMYGRAYYLVRRKWPEMYCVYPHRIRRLHDALKAINVVAALLYQPWLSAWRLAAWRDRVPAAAILFLAGLAWKGGMAIQRLRAEG